jgi:hypothetical protein
MLVCEAPGAQQGSGRAAAPLVRLPIGAWVRLEAPEVMPGRITGHLLSADAEELVVAVGNRLPIAVPRAALTRAEVSLRRHNSWRRGALIGAATGLLIGAIATGGDFDEGGDVGHFSRGGVIAMSAIAFAGNGALIGVLVKREDWRVVPTASLKLSLVPIRGRGAALGVTLSF